MAEVIVRYNVLNWEADQNDHGTYTYWNARLVCGHTQRFHLGSLQGLPLRLACDECIKIARNALG